MRGKVAGALRPFDQEIWEGSVERWTVEVGKSMFQARYTRSDPSSGSGEINGFNITFALTTRTKNGSRTAPSNQAFKQKNSNGKKKGRRTAFSFHKWIHAVKYLCRWFWGCSVKLLAKVTLLGHPWGGIRTTLKWWISMSTLPSMSIHRLRWWNIRHRWWSTHHPRRWTRQRRRWTIMGE